MKGRVGVVLVRKSGGGGGKICAGAISIWCRDVTSSVSRLLPESYTGGDFGPVEDIRHWRECFFDLGFRLYI